MSKILSGLGIFDALEKKPAPALNTGAKQIIGYAASGEAEGSALKPFRPSGRVFESKLPGVSNEAWTDFVFVMKTADLRDVSPSNGLGWFGMKYKRLADLGLVTNVRYKRGVAGVQEADWKDPLTLDKFLHSPNAQYDTFEASMRDYYNMLLNGGVTPPNVPSMTVSGALAILHRGGPRALADWKTTQFESTREIYQRANGVF